MAWWRWWCVAEVAYAAAAYEVVVQAFCMPLLMLVLLSTTLNRACIVFFCQAPRVRPQQISVALSEVCWANTD